MEISEISIQDSESLVWVELSMAGKLRSSRKARKERRERVRGKKNPLGLPSPELLFFSPLSAIPTPDLLFRTRDGAAPLRDGQGRASKPSEKREKLQQLCASFPARCN